MLTDVPDQAAVATAEVQPADAVQSSEQLLDGARDAAPLVLADGSLGVGELKAVIDQRIRSVSGVVAIVVDLGKLGPRVGDEGKTTVVTSPQLIIPLAIAPMDLAETLGAGTTDAT